MNKVTYNDRADSSPSGIGGINVGIIGGAGYTGGELIRLLINHPKAAIVFIHSNSNAGKKVSQIHQDLLGETNLIFTNKLPFTNNDTAQGSPSGAEGLDVLILCTAHGEARKFLEENAIPFHVKVIDLSNDFRLLKNAEFHQPTASSHTFIRQFVYGLPELNRAAIQSARNIANPGCFATVIQLGLLPLAKTDLLGEVYTTGITGSTGAGQSLSATSHFSWRANNIQAYKTLSHQHLGEIVQSLVQLQPKQDAVDLSFVPWRGDFTRGIFVSSVIHSEKKLEELVTIFKDFYQASSFTFISDEPIFLKQVINTNKCFIQLEKVGSKLIVHSIIDNLLKGASGQAIQNMNLMFGLEETTGLKLKAIGF